MDMRLPAGVGPAAATRAEAQPPLRLLQRWQPSHAVAPSARTGDAGRIPHFVSRLQQLFGR